MILHGEALRDVTPAMYRARSLISHRGKRSTPLAVNVLAAHVSRLTVIDVLIAHGTVHEVFVFLILAEFLRSLCYGVIVVGIFQCLRDRFRLLVERHIAERTVLRQAVVVVVHCRCYHCLEGAFVVESLDVLAYHVRQYSRGMIAYHAPCLIAGKRPVGQHLLHTLVIMCKHGVCHIRLNVLMHKIHQRMECPVRVPERELGAVCEPALFLDVLVESEIRAVGVIVYKRTQRGMIC